MKRKDFIKITLATFMNLGILATSVLLGLFFTKTLYGTMLYFIFGATLVLVIMIFCYPIWFKDYIKEFWEKHESKNM